MGKRTVPAVGAENQPQARVASASIPGAFEASWARPALRSWRYAALRRILACADLTAGLLGITSLLVVSSVDAEQFAWGLVYLPAWVLIAKLLGLYDRDEEVLRHVTVDEIPRLVLWALIGSVGLSIFLELTPAGRPDSSTMIAVGAAVTIAVLPLRALGRWAWRALTPPERVALIGAKGDTDSFKRKLELFPDVHMLVIDELDELDFEAGDYGWLDGVDRVVIMPTSLDNEGISELFPASRAFGALLTVIPPRGGAFGHAVRLSQLAELHVLDYGKVDLSRSTLLLKRTLDIGFSALLVVLLSPVLLAIAAAVKLDSRGPIIFSQWRAGEGGRPFRMHKFRTMVPNAEKLLPQLVRLDDLVDPAFKLEHDPRVTHIGRRLRRWSLDELPQLVNILRGEMSLVGPRPEQVEVVDRYLPEQRLRLLVKPGLTGPMQVYGRGALEFSERIAIERDYIENLSLGRDMQILAMTISAVLRGRGAF
jgi:exopolysaccharide biosynthesis polyprenyl glycosylphosphotransferase